MKKKNKMGMEGSGSGKGGGSSGLGLTEQPLTARGLTTARGRRERATNRIKRPPQPTQLTGNSRLRF